jgi:hypothetical protein
MLRPRFILMQIGGYHTGRLGEGYRVLHSSSFWRVKWAGCKGYSLHLDSEVAVAAAPAIGGSMVRDCGDPRRLYNYIRSRDG